ncbi:MAG: ATP-binding cassette domain-containing protein [Actinomycetota bacterium]|nr:ATP-binding cassette domain-containing protein [Actinomycetota bacterium]
MPTPESAARCEDVVKTYRLPGSEVRALSGVSAEFPRSGLSAVVGPSGSGKSSLLRLLSGLDRPTSGRVEVDGAVVSSASSASRRELRRHRVGFVFQRPSDNFLPYLSVLDHLHIAARGPSGRPFDIHGVLDLLGIGARATHLPAELSGGEQQRAALAQAFVSGANVLLADEPTAELDAHSASVLIEAMRGLLELGVTVLVATHDRGLARAAAEVVRLEHGRVRSPSAARRSDQERPAAAAPSTWRPAEIPGGSGNVWRPPEQRGIPEGRDGAGAVPRADVVVALRSVGKRYRRGNETVHAVEGVSLDLFAGEAVGLVGRSGSGKTTLLNLLAEWERPDDGRIERAGAAEPSWREIAVVPQQLGLIEELTIGENVAFPAKLAGVLDRTGPMVDQLLEALGLTHLVDRYPQETSLGEQQRAAVARAAVLAPRLLLADESTGHQDDASSRAVFEVLRLAADGGTCCVVATHDEAVSAYLDRTLGMADGRLIPSSGLSGE